MAAIGDTADSQESGRQSVEAVISKAAQRVRDCAGSPLPASS